MKQITSLQNSYIKNLIKLQEKSRERKKQGLFLVEGKREITLVTKGNYDVETILIAKDICQSDNELETIFDTFNCIEITKEIYERLAYRDSTEGVIAVVNTKKHTLKDLELNKTTPLILVLESIEKPGNIGAMLRSADAANLDAIFIADSKTDIYNPNIIRSSVGCLFTNKIVVDTSENIIQYLKENKINIYSATLQNSNKYHEVDYTKPTSIVVGTEATGLSQIWRDQATQNINIPMQGEIDSMNVSVAAAIIIFEAKRQRNFN
ncbi:TrmH family RNA methyltransferase [Tenacibaculum agarivorans]|uniref:TrmH family RNA methyltransferase n=1 Tax=Tenacibaculum agarivorans TaxID=1908389 RepID=UPI00094B87AE|nr:RNA methyltransferase [Tenacibaculum agarivorans]